MPYFRFLRPTGGPGPGGNVTAYELTLGGQIDTVPLPLTNCANDIIAFAQNLTNMRGRRGTPGIAGITTVQLEIDSVPVVGATLSWTPVDAAFAYKSIVIAVPVVIGQKLSFRLTSAETGAEDVFVEVD